VLVYTLPFQPNRYGCHANTIHIGTLWNIFTSWVNRSDTFQWQWSSYSCGVLGWKFRITLWYLRMTVLFSVFFIVEAVCNSSMVQFPLFGNENDRLVCDWLISKDLKRYWSNRFIDLAFTWMNWRKYREAAVIIAGLQVQIQTWHLAWRKEAFCTVCTPFWSGFRVKFGGSNVVWGSSVEIAKLRINDIRSVVPFDVLLTVHLSIILVIHETNVQILVL